MAHDQKDEAIRKHVLYLLRGGGAHQSFEDFVGSFPADLCNRRIEGLPYTPWQVLEHMRLAQWDILEFSRDSSHVSPDFPKGYWPKPHELGTAARWRRTIEAFRNDLQQMETLVEDPSTDLYAPIPHGEGQTILREALLVADHNAYHLGVLAVMERIVKAGPTSGI
jgi:DinB superfamily